MIKTKEQIYILSSGKRINAYNDIIGIDDDGGIFEGYDDSIWGGFKDKQFEPFTTDEKKEIADFMIARWTEFKKNLGE